VAARHGLNARRRPRSNPLARAAWTSSVPPAEEANGSVPATKPDSGAQRTRRRRLTRPGGLFTAID